MEAKKKCKNKQGDTIFSFISLGFEFLLKTFASLFHAQSLSYSSESNKNELHNNFINIFNGCDPKSIIRPAILGWNGKFRLFALFLVHFFGIFRFILFQIRIGRRFFIVVLINIFVVAAAVVFILLISPII